MLARVGSRRWTSATLAESVKAAQGNALGVGHDLDFGADPTFGRADAVPPFRASAKVASAKNSEVSSSPASWSSSKCWDTSTPELAASSESLFQTGWFLESLPTQTLIIHVIRTNKIPFLQSRPSWPLLAMSGVIMAVGIAIPFTPVGGYLEFTAPPPLYLALLALTLLCYVVLTQSVKVWLLRRKWIGWDATERGTTVKGKSSI